MGTEPDNQVIMFRSFAVLALAVGANAFAPSTFGVRTFTSLNENIKGIYDDKVFDNEAKKAVYDAWDPSQPRSGLNFNPFETFGGNSPDASGVFPGQPFYKDPMRGEINFEQMMLEKSEAEERAANPKEGDVPGAPGCMN